MAYAARPIGAVVLRHFGDRIGRKTMLIFTLLLMGASTIAIGLLPTYAQVGILAPILLVVLRLLQGLSAAGEQAGANSMALEHAPADRRGYFTSFTLSGTQMELILATLVFLPIGALPEDALQSWGSRVPFLLSTIVVAVGLWVRRALPETPAFEEVDEGHEKAAFPAAVLFRTHGVDVLRVVVCAFIAVVSTIFTVFTLSYAVDEVGISRPRMLSVLIAANVVALGAIPCSRRCPTGSVAGLSSSSAASAPPRSSGPTCGRSAARTTCSSSCSACCCPVSSTARRTACGPRSTARCSTPACATPAWPSARRSASRSRASRR